MKQVLLKKGKVYTSDIAKPVVEKDFILVKTKFSCISAGTELSSVASSGTPIIKRIIDSPELINKGINLIKERGIKDSLEFIKGKYDVGMQMGYSASGIVVESGTPVFAKGDRVACMGAGYANHADYILVPKNLAAKIPDNVSYEYASTAALGCIAMQGIRRADVRLGEYVVIIGMGILGQLASRLATASGATVIATDLDERRLNIAKNNGILYTLNAENDVVSQVLQITGGYGADSVIVTAATDSNELLSQAFKMSRKRGKVVLVGVAGMNLKREDMYQKELELLMSTSYGPGRYDVSYEEEGKDYPYAYVRFTEKRNLESYLTLLSNNMINISDIIEAIYPVEEADKAYEDLKHSEKRPLIALIKYDDDQKNEDNIFITSTSTRFKPSNEVIKVALCGAGNFAKDVHLPNLNKLKHMFMLHAVQSRNGANAHEIALKYNASYSTTDYHMILNDKDVDMVMICTRHNTHASMIVEALKAGKAVFVEKPMALTYEETKEIVKTVKETGLPFMVGFNRRFSQYAQEVKRIISNRVNPLIITYRMNAGYIPLDNWIQTSEGGGRIIGEGCHIIDLFTYFTDSKAESITVNQITPKTDNVSRLDNCVITIKFEDGSLGTLIYTGQGHKEYGKEYCEIFFDGKVIIIDDYKQLLSYGVKSSGLKTAVSEKGHYEELIEFYTSIRKGDGYPIPIWQLEQTTLLSIMGQEL